jgi:undecaprenyl-diphosphatase
VLHEHALVVAGVLLLVGAVMSFVFRASPEDSFLQPVDDAWLEWMVAARVDWLVTVAKAISFLGSVVVTWPLRILASLVLAWHRRWLQLSAFLAAAVASELMIGPLKAWVERPRPPDSLVETSNFSYPSGHAIVGAVTAFALVVAFMHARRERLKMIGLAATFAALMALSRTYLSAHWLTDVIGGGCLGVGVALVFPATFEMVREAQRTRARIGAASRLLDRGRRRSPLTPSDDRSDA